MVPSDWDSAPMCVCGPNFISDSNGKISLFFWLTLAQRAVQASCRLATASRQHCKLLVNLKATDLLKTLATRCLAKFDFSCVETLFFSGSRHCISVLQTQVQKLCTDLDLSLLYISILRTYSKFARKKIS